MPTDIRIEFDVAATMRDGTVLRANILRPAEGGPYPVALIRTPYGKDLAMASLIVDPLRLARAGYMVAIQDVRGRFRSEGEWSPLVHEAQDGYDTVEWAATLAGSSGAVGMCGGSYMGFTQWAAAMEAPPHLKAIAPAVTWASARNGLTWRGGALELGKLARWQLGNIAFDLTLRRCREAPREAKMEALATLAHEVDHLGTEGYYALPLAEFEPFVRVGIPPDVLHIISEPYSRSYNAPFSVAEAYDRIQVPALNIGGWYDICAQGTLDNFSALRNHGTTPQARQAMLLMGPWSHTTYGNVVGELDFGIRANAALIDLAADLTEISRRWFDCWLKGIDNGITRQPPARIFVMGVNTWRHEHEWPLPRTHYTPYFLHSHGHANTLLGDGTLSAHRPGHEPADRFTYDPADPTPTCGGAILMNPLYGQGVKDQRPVEARPDVLVYTSETLADDIEVTGPVSVRLWAASTAPDTDFVARLVDVHPNGFAQNLTDGIIRARYRDGDQPKLLQPGRVYEFTIDLWSTANVFKAGHRVRLDIASASFPRWDRNPNTGQPFGTDPTTRPAQQTILHDAEHPSHVLLPIVVH